MFIRGRERGPGQHERDLLIDEWTIGPYFREVSLPQPGDGARTNATYDNGVLVLVMPKQSPRRRTPPGELQLQSIISTCGEHTAHTGSDIRPTTNDESASTKAWPSAAPKKGSLINFSD